MNINYLLKEQWRYLNCSLRDQVLALCLERLSMKATGCLMLSPLQKLFCQTLHLFDKPTLFGEIKMGRNIIRGRLSLLLVKSIGGNFALGNDLFPSQVFWWEKYIIDQ